jgi:Flp pilus assembly protein protease CpaA
MQTSMWFAPVVGLVFACAAFLTLQFAAYLCERITPFEDGPPLGNPPTWWLVGGCGVLGFLLSHHGISPMQLAFSLLLVAGLAACWYSDVRCGIVPDYFTLIPLVVGIGLAIWARDYGALVSGTVTAVPFAAAAIMSKGKGMGWGDVKLAALGGVALGMGQAVVAFSIACIVAVAIAYFRGTRTQPVAFAPYMVGSMSLVLAVAAIL